MLRISIKCDETTDDSGQRTDVPGTSAAAAVHGRLLKKTKIHFPSSTNTFSFRQNLLY